MNFKTKFLWLVLPIFILSACNLQLVESPQDPNDANLGLTAIVQQMLIDQAAQQGNRCGNHCHASTGQCTGAPPTEEAVVPAAVLPPATGDVTVTVSVATNCRQGPGAALQSIYGMPVGQVAQSRRQEFLFGLLDHRDSRRSRADLLVMGAICDHQQGIWLD
ncbi:MAG: hypothetical protein IPJ47_17440 [Anaerolineales bacterium]|nr:hypothetical protein [Anaerolineales bacterium]